MKSGFKCGLFSFIFILESGHFALKPVSTTQHVALSHFPSLGLSF